MSERDALLATKLHVPGPQPGFTSRPRLLEALGERLARGFTLVCAPAGSGKTAVLADWARRTRWPVAWLSIDPGDNDPARFWRHATAAVDTIKPGIRDRVGPLLRRPEPRSLEGLVTGLINELADGTDQDGVLLVLDDYHLIDSQPVHTSVTFLAEHLPPRLRLVLASRSDPPLPLPRLRASGQLSELRAADLRFTADEAAALLRKAAGSSLPSAAVAALTARTEGWAAGLQLAGLSLRDQADAARFVTKFSGSHRYVLDYLAEEVLDRQSKQMREFLLETSVLERLSGELCNAVTGLGLQAIGEAERAGPSPAVADLLNPVPAYRARLLLAQGDLAAAARWVEERGLHEDSEPAYTREREYLVLARVLLAQHLPDRALTLLQRLLDTAESQDRTGSVIEIRTLQTLALANSGDQAGAAAALAEVLALARPQGYIRILADEGAPMRDLLSQLAAAQTAGKATDYRTQSGYLARILRAFDGKADQAGVRAGAAATVRGMIEPLTAREMEVLELLTGGTPNRRIAEELVITRDTVKKHITHILSKLGAANRTEAAARARQLGLIP